MKKLIIVRHGNYEKDENKVLRLSESGKEQLTKLGDVLFPVLRGTSMIILSSTAQRAIDSAKVLGDMLGIEYEEHEVLWDDFHHWGDKAESIVLIDSKRPLADVVLVVTHLELTQDLPKYYVKEVLKIDTYIHTVPKGEAWEIDFEDCTAIRISP